MFTTRLLAAAALAAALCVQAYADDAYPPPNTPPNPPPNALPITPPNPLTADENAVRPQYNQIPQDYDEFAAVYNKALAFLRATGIQSVHKCYPAGTTPSHLIGWCQDFMTWADPKGQSVTVSDTIKDDGKHFVSVCLGGDDMIRRCYRDDGAVYDQTHDYKAKLWVTFRHIAAAWNERGKPLADLKPRAPSPPEAAASPPEPTPQTAPSPPAHPPSTASPTPPPTPPSPPAAAASLPADELAIPQIFSQAPADNDEFVAGYNKALAFLRQTEVKPEHKCWPVGADPTMPLSSWCSDTMRWGEPSGKHISTTEAHIDDGRVINATCLGDDKAHQRCFFSDGRVADQLLDQKTNLYLPYRQITARWNERGKPLSDLKPNAPNPPAEQSPPAAAPTPLAEQSPPAATSVLPPKYDHIPNSYDEFIAAYNNALAFLRDHGTGPVQKCFPAGSIPIDRRGWCQDTMCWVNDKGQHLCAADIQRDDRTKVINLCFGDDMTTQRCYEDDGAVFDQSLNQKTKIWITSRRVAWAWNERGKPLSNLSPREKQAAKQRH